MSTVTYKQAQFAARYRGQSEMQCLLNDAALIRTWGTRLPICEKNVGQAKYAFNSVRHKRRVAFRVEKPCCEDTNHISRHKFQVQFMPEALRPPISTLAGFKKYFTGEGIET